MSLPTLQLRSISTAHYYASGDVTIEAGAAIAPGVLLQADPDGCIVIRAGACIGIGSILHARRGTVEISEGANIGAEVLLIGQVTIGANACIGSATTILNSVIDRDQVVPPGSLVGDNSPPGEAREPELQPTDTAALLLEKPIAPLSAPIASVNPPSSVSVCGQVYVNQMLGRMFPNRASTSPQPSPPSTLAQDPWNE